jgi:hypothetical protein
VRQYLGNEGAKQAAGQHTRQDAAEQPEVMGEDFRDTVDAVAPVDQSCTHRDQYADHDHRPADRLAGASRTRLALRGVRRRVF